MSYSIVAFLWRKPDTPPEEFKLHYETIHIPLLASLMGPLFPKSHTRFYLPRKHAAGSVSSEKTNIEYPANIFLGKADDFDFDAFASIVFDHEEAFNQFHARLMDPDVAARIRADEEKFLQHEKLVVAAAGAPFVTLQPVTE